MASDRRGGGILSALVLALFSFAAGAGVMYFILGGRGPVPVPVPSPRAAALAPSPSPAPSPTPDPDPSASPFDPLAPPETGEAALPDSGAAASAPAATPPAGDAPQVASAATPAPPRPRVRPARPAASPPAAAPGPDQAAPARAAAPPAQPPPAGRFAAGVTTVESLKGSGGALKGFEQEGVGVKRAPDVNGRLDLQVEPATARPGQPFTVKVYLVNEGKRAIRVRELRVSTVTDGRWSHQAVPAPASEIRPRARLLVHEVPGQWKDGVRSWALEVVATSDREDVYRNALYWQ